jgi:hypothetical protein
MTQNFTIESQEYLVWEGYPSQAINLKFYALFGLGLLFSVALIFSHLLIGTIGAMVFCFLIFDKYIEVKDTHYALTHERLRIVIGGLLTGRQRYEINITDLLDVKSNESLIDQVFGTCTLVLDFRGDPLLSSYKDLYKKGVHIMKGLKDPEKSFELIRAGIKDTKNRGTLNRDNQFSFKFDQKKNTPKLLD